MNNRSPSAIMLVVVFVITILMVIATFLFWSTEAEGHAMATNTPRPTMPPGTPTYEILLPFVEKGSLTPTVTPRPTAQGE